jgi:peptidoglycan-associated lipoprotein
MTPRLLPALCAALLLAACGSDAEKQSDTQPPQLANAGGTGLNGDGGITGSGNGTMTTAEAMSALQSIGNTVYFDTDSYSLNAQAQTVLQKQAVFLKQNPQHGITIEGHADERGTREYNLALGERRAVTVVNYLTALGIDGARLKEISYGKEKPICVDSTESCWGQNRRGVTTLDN